MTDFTQKKLEEFNEKFQHNDFCKNFPEGEPKNCRCDFIEFKAFLKESIEQAYKEGWNDRWKNELDGLKEFIDTKLSSLNNQK